MSTTEVIVRSGSRTDVTFENGVTTELGPRLHLTELVMASVVVGPPGPVGPPGGSLPTLTFSYGDATPSLIATLTAGSRPFNVRLSIETPFNGAGAQLSVGTLLNPNLLVPAADIDPAVAAVFEFSPQTLFLSDTAVYLFITPGSGASAGAGNVIIQRQ